MTNEKFAAYENLGRNIIAHLVANGKFPADKCWQLDAMLEAFGYDKLGLKGMFANELKMLCTKHCAYETKTSHAKPIEYVFAKVLEMRDINLSVLNDLHFGTEPSEAQLERIQRAKDSISIKVNASEAGAEPAKRTVSNNGAQPEYNKRIDPALSAAIAKASKPNEQFRFDLLLSTLEEEGFHVELKGDVAEVYIDADNKKVEAGIIRYSSPMEMAEDLNTLCEKCPLINGQRRINVAVVINKVLHPEKADNESSAEAAVNSLIGTFEHQDFYNFKDKTADKEENPYDKLAKQTVSKTQLLTFDVDLEYQGRICRVKRQISVLSEEKGFYHGYVYHNNGNYLGHWYWNTKYLWPIFVSKQQNIGDENKARYERAIRKALKGIGIYSKYMPESANRYAV